MKIMARVVIGVCMSAAGAAAAGALDECKGQPDPAAITRCLREADKDAQLALNKAEGDAARRARELDVATGRAGAAASLAKSMRAFGDYRKAQCDFVRSMYASGNGAEQGQLGCIVDITRRRVRDFLN